ncbi:helix-turn-helix domain-containing protein [Pseudomonas sp. CDFA 602]|uniref:DNA-3-methyladenine glycosylase 2 family protein n=1 Tax=Pseudomonas californiensis TaxID=2829823 RepID=UPI001E52779E|nr:DNA-3-methyladenine glycosylase 2 family protein [Pseudomonas californiensis]MCD5994752.1 helix-turn-helix domain-containing protein [Pseudomonas californiensis]MCD6000263.1 helix-turn-helix domain-containing protein [Pseudomonas californiensis]
MKTLDPSICYAAFIARDRRFDGWFFMGVSSTGIYCRPMCPVRAPQAKNCSFYTTAAAAEQAGYRPCLRCRPELAPGNSLLDVSSRLAQAAARLIEEGFLSGRTLDALAQRVGVTSRHLRRIFEAEFGVSMIDFAQTQRLLIAKRLLTDTGLSMTDVALASGFGSVRRFNDVFKARYRLNPLRLRKVAHPAQASTLQFELSYRPPFSWSGVLAFLAHRCVAGVEHVSEHAYTRVIDFERAGCRLAGWVSVTHAPLRHALVVTVSASLQAGIAFVLAGVRRVFDTGCRPDLVDAHLGGLINDHPGMRVPGAFDGFEIAVRAVVGQQISVINARAILGRLALRFGTPVVDAPSGLQHAFPTAEAIARLHYEDLIAAGLIRIRAEAILAVAQEVSAGRIILEPLVLLEETLVALRHIRGIGEWTVQYIAMRALCWPNAFPAGDAVLKKHLGCDTAAQLNQHATQWAPWRAYATVHVWRQYEEAKR